MTDHHDEKMRKRKLASEYSEKIQRQHRKIDGILSKEQRSFFRNTSGLSDTTIYSDLVTAMRNSHTVPSQYVANELGWLFNGAIPSRDEAVILYFADQLREYPYSDSYMRRSFRSRSNGAYASKLAKIIRGYSFSNMLDEPLEKILNRELSEDAQAYLDLSSWNGCGYS